jgi:hypothetical protein
MVKIPNHGTNLQLKWTKDVNKSYETNCNMNKRWTKLLERKNDDIQNQRKRDGWKMEALDIK